MNGGEALFAVRVPFMVHALTQLVHGHQRFDDGCGHGRRVGRLRRHQITLTHDTTTPSSTTTTRSSKRLSSGMMILISGTTAVAVAAEVVRSTPIRTV